jgi:hypothetical protein
VRLTPYLALLATLAGPATVLAQEQDVAPGTLSRAIAREVGRLAVQTDQDVTSTRATSASGDWSRVLALTPGREIILTTDRLARSKQRLLSADHTGLTILNVSDPALSKQVRDQLVRTAERHPACFAEADRGSQFVLDKGVLLGPIGVFQNERRIIAVADILERVPRDKVVELTVVRKHIGQHARRGLLIGAAAGAMVGAIGASTCGPDTEPGYCNVGGMAAAGILLGGLAGLEYGTIIGIIIPRSPDVIYRR